MDGKLLFRYDDAWSERALADVLEAMHEIAINDLGLSVFPNQVVIVNDLGMLDAFANNGMPSLYAHWSFGKQWKKMQLDLKNGDMGLAYELIVPTNPCISWNLASNSMATMALVIAHAAFGHNHVFKNNYVFQKWTHYSTLADYCRHARDVVLEFEKRYGERAVEEILDAAHALALPSGIFRHGEPPPFDIKEEKNRLADHMRAIERSIDYELLGTVPGLPERLAKVPNLAEDTPHLPEENILYFIEKHSPKLKAWEREILRMVRTISQQAAYPSIQTKTLNEGAAMFVENYILSKLDMQGRVDPGTMIHSARLNSNVLYQPELRKTRELSAQFNPYALGFAICKEIVRISGPTSAEDKALFEGWIDTSGPTLEDKQWFSWAGDGAWRERLRDAWANYNDESFIMQFLSPRLMREWQLFVIIDQDEDFYCVTDTVHERTPRETGYESIRYQLAAAHTFDARLPDIRVTGADLYDDRTLELTYYPRYGMDLNHDSTKGVLKHIGRLWGYEVTLDIKDEDD